MFRRTVVRPPREPRTAGTDSSERITKLLARASGVAAAVAIACLGLALVASQAGFTGGVSLATDPDPQGGKRLAPTVPAVSSPVLGWGSAEAGVVVEPDPPAPPVVERAASSVTVALKAPQEALPDGEPRPAVHPVEEDTSAPEAAPAPVTDRETPQVPVPAQPDEPAEEPQTPDAWWDWWEEQGEQLTEALNEMLLLGRNAEFGDLRHLGHLDDARR